VSPFNHLWKIAFLTSSKQLASWRACYIDQSKIFGNNPSKLSSCLYPKFALCLCAPPIIAPTKIFRRFRKNFLNFWAVSICCLEYRVITSIWSSCIHPFETSFKTIQSYLTAFRSVVKILLWSKQASKGYHQEAAQATVLLRRWYPFLHPLGFLESWIVITFLWRYSQWKRSLNRMFGLSKIKSWFPNLNDLRCWSRATLFWLIDCFNIQFLF